MEGYVWLHRRLIEKGYYTNSQYVHLWVHLLLLANHTEKEFLWNGRIIKVKPGQFITGRTQLVKQTGIPKSTIERALALFETEAQIGQQKTNKYRLITILKWTTYQSERATGGQQTGTNKNDKNDKNKITASPKTARGSPHSLTDPDPSPQDTDPPPPHNKTTMRQTDSRKFDSDYEDVVDLDSQQLTDHEGEKKKIRLTTEARFNRFYSFTIKVLNDVAGIQLDPPLHTNARKIFRMLVARKYTDDQIASIARHFKSMPKAKEYPSINACYSTDTINSWKIQNQKSPYFT